MDGKICKIEDNLQSKKYVNIIFFLIQWQFPHLFCSSHRHHRRKIQQEESSNEENYNFLYVKSSTTSITNFGETLHCCEFFGTLDFEWENFHVSFYIFLADYLFHLNFSYEFGRHSTSFRWSEQRNPARYFTRHNGLLHFSSSIFVNGAWTATSFRLFAREILAFIVTCETNYSIGVLVISCWASEGLCWWVEVLTCSTCRRNSHKRRAREEKLTKFHYLQIFCYLRYSSPSHLICMSAILLLLCDRHWSPGRWNLIIFHGDWIREWWVEANQMCIQVIII